MRYRTPVFLGDGVRINLWMALLTIPFAICLAAVAARVVGATCIPPIVAVVTRKAVAQTLTQGLDSLSASIRWPSLPERFAITAAAGLIAGESITGGGASLWRMVENL